MCLGIHGSSSLFLHLNKVTIFTVHVLTAQIYIYKTEFLVGKDGVTHNMLDDIHSHWKRAEAVRIKCLGVPTLDMDNICFHLEVWQL